MPLPHPPGAPLGRCGSAALLLALLLLACAASTSAQHGVSNGYFGDVNDASQMEFQLCAVEYAYGYECACAAAANATSDFRFAPTIDQANTALRIVAATATYDLAFTLPAFYRDVAVSLPQCGGLVVPASAHYRVGCDVQWTASFTYNEHTCTFLYDTSAAGFVTWGVYVTVSADLTLRTTGNVSTSIHLAQSTSFNVLLPTAQTLADIAATVTFDEAITPNATANATQPIANATQPAANVTQPLNTTVTANVTAPIVLPSITPLVESFSLLFDITSTVSNVIFSGAVLLDLTTLWPYMLVAPSAAAHPWVTGEAVAATSPQYTWTTGDARFTDCTLHSPSGASGPVCAQQLRLPLLLVGACSVDSNYAISVLVQCVPNAVGCSVPAGYTGATVQFHITSSNLCGGNVLTNGGQPLTFDIVRFVTPDARTAEIIVNATQSAAALTAAVDAINNPTVSSSFLATGYIPLLAAVLSSKVIVAAINFTAVTVTTSANPTGTSVVLNNVPNPSVPQTRSAYAHMTSTTSQVWSLLSFKQTEAVAANAPPLAITLTASMIIEYSMAAHTSGRGSLFHTEAAESDSALETAQLRASHGVRLFATMPLTYSTTASVMADPNVSVGGGGNNGGGNNGGGNNGGGGTATGVAGSTTGAVGGTTGAGVGSTSTGVDGTPADGTTGGGHNLGGVSGASGDTAGGAQIGGGGGGGASSGAAGSLSTVPASGGAFGDAASGFLLYIIIALAVLLFIILAAVYLRRRHLRREHEAKVAQGAAGAAVAAAVEHLNAEHMVAQDAREVDPDPNSSSEDEHVEDSAIRQGQQLPAPVAMQIAPDSPQSRSSVSSASRSSRASKASNASEDDGPAPEPVAPLELPAVDAAPLELPASFFAPLPAVRGGALAPVTERPRTALPPLDSPHSNPAASVGLDLDVASPTSLGVALGLTSPLSSSPWPAGGPLSSPLGNAPSSSSNARPRAQLRPLRPLPTPLAKPFTPSSFGLRADPVAAPAAAKIAIALREKQPVVLPTPQGVTLNFAPAPQ